MSEIPGFTARATLAAEISRGAAPCTLLTRTRSRLPESEGLTICRRLTSFHSPSVGTNSFHGTACAEPQEATQCREASWAGGADAQPARHAAASRHAATAPWRAC